MQKHLPALTNASMLHSGPLKHSSSKTRLPASPNAPLKHAFMASFASATVCATTTPLPAAKPSAFTTTGAPISSNACKACASLVASLYAAVGMLCLLMNCLAKSLLPSSLAPVAAGPNTAIHSARNTSATPATSGASGPITTRSACTLRARSSTSSPLFMLTPLTFSPRTAVPPLPGAIISRSHLGLLRRAQANACSRPPEPNSKMFMFVPYLFA